jgi:hypothetical protein
MESTVAKDLLLTNEPFEEVVPLVGDARVALEGAVAGVSTNS